MNISQQLFLIMNDFIEPGVKATLRSYQNLFTGAYEKISRHMNQGKLLIIIIMNLHRANLYHNFFSLILSPFKRPFFKRPTVMMTIIIFINNP